MYIPGQKYETMVGIGCGKEGTHAIELPIDTVRFLKAVDEKRKSRTGAVVLADLNANPKRVEYRKRIIQIITGITALDQPVLEVVQQSEMSRDEDYSEIKISDTIQGKEREYFEEEIKDCKSLLERYHGIKFGWILDQVKFRTGEINIQKSKGGELVFDQEIERNYPKQYIFEYTDVVGIPTSETYGKKKCPYVVKERERNERLCIVGPEELELEIERLQKMLRMETAQSEKAVRAAIDFSNIALDRDPKNTDKKDIVSLFREAELKFF